MENEEDWELPGAGGDGGILGDCRCPKMGRCQTDPRESCCLARAPQEQVATGEIKIETGKQAPSRDRGKKGRRDGPGSPTPALSWGVALVVGGRPGHLKCEVVGQKHKLVPEMTGPSSDLGSRGRVEIRDLDQLKHHAPDMDTASHTWKVGAAGTRLYHRGPPPGQV